MRLLSIVIVFALVAIFLESSLSLRGGRLGGARGGIKKKRANKTRKAKARETEIEKKLDDIADSLIFDMTSGNWTEMEDRTWIYASALFEMSDVYHSHASSREKAALHYCIASLALHFGIVTYVFLTTTCIL